jgi:hypothetical protein
MKNNGKFEALENFKKKTKETMERGRRRWRERGIRGMYIGQKEMVQSYQFSTWSWFWVLNDYYTIKNNLVWTTLL